MNNLKVSFTIPKAITINNKNNNIENYDFMSRYTHVRYVVFKSPLINLLLASTTWSLRDNIKTSVL